MTETELRVNAMAEDYRQTITMLVESKVLLAVQNALLRSEIAQLKEAANVRQKQEVQ